MQYLYITNNSADVMAIADTSGNILANYSYDEWGKVTVNATDDENAELANFNPLRYRGYYYDNETDYYYLQSRYYDPNICRFINADLPEYAQMQKSIHIGMNSFAYCCNDAVNCSDCSGNTSQITSVSYRLVSWCYYAKKKKIIMSAWMSTADASTIGQSITKSVGCDLSVSAGINIKAVSVQLGIKISFTVSTGTTYVFKPNSKKGKYVRVVAYITKYKRYYIERKEVITKRRYTYKYGHWYWEVYSSKSQYKYFYLYQPLTSKNYLYFDVEYTNKL